MSRPAARKAGNGRRPARPLDRLRFEAGEAIYDKGAASDAFYRIVSGKVHLLSRRRRKGMDPDVLGPGAVFGQSGVLSRAARRDCATAASDVELDVLERRDALKLLDRGDSGIRELLAGLFELAGQADQTDPLNDRVEIDVDGVRKVPRRMVRRNPDPVPHAELRSRLRHVGHQLPAHDTAPQRGDPLARMAPQRGPPPACVCWSAERPPGHVPGTRTRGRAFRDR